MLARVHKSRTAVLLAFGLVLVAAPALAQPDRSGPPKAGPARALVLPPIDRHTLSNDLPVHLVGLHEVPVVEVYEYGDYVRVWGGGVNGSSQQPAVSSRQPVGSEEGVSGRIRQIGQIGSVRSDGSDRSD